MNRGPGDEGMGEIVRTVARRDMDEARAGVVGDIGASSFEFIEIKNIGANDVNLINTRFSTKIA